MLRSLRRNLARRFWNHTCTTAPCTQHSTHTHTRIHGAVQQKAARILYNVDAVRVVKNVDEAVTEPCTVSTNTGKYGTIVVDVIRVA